MKKSLRALLALPAVLLVLLLALAACRSGESASDELTSDSGGSASAAEPSTGRADESGADVASGSAKQAVAPLSRAVISTGQVTLHSREIIKARAEVMRLVAAWGGTVSDEQTNSDARGRVTDSTLTLRVPTPRFSEAMTAFAGLGEVEQESRKSEDVTTRVIDNDARVRAAERSIRQIEALLGRATKLSDIISIESDLARRQADLDSLKSQQAYLEDQTSLSTINVYLSRSAPRATPPQDARGFVTGLENGWDALTGATVVLLTVVGAALPFALVLGLLGVPVWLVLRRRRSLAPAPAPEA